MCLVAADCGRSPHGRRSRSLLFDEQPALTGEAEERLLLRLGVVEAVLFGSRTWSPKPNCGNSNSGLSKEHREPRVSHVNHVASRALTTNQPSPAGDET